MRGLLLLLVVVDLFVLGVDHVIFRLGTGVAGLATALLGRLGLGRIHLLCQVAGGLGQLVELGLDVVLVVTLDRLLELLGGALDGFLLLVGGVLAGFLNGLAGGVDHAVGLVAQLDQLLELLVLVGVGLGVADHLLDLVVGEAAGGLDDDGLLLAGGLVLGGDVQDAVGVQVEGDLDLRHAAGRRRNVGQVEATQGLVAARLLALALQHVDGHGGLVVIRGREGLGLLGRD